MTSKELYDFSYDFLVEQAEGVISQNEIDDFLKNPDITSSWSSREDVYELLAIILQDFNRYPNVINFKERKTEIKTILKNYDLTYISALFADDLLNAFKAEFGFAKDTMWKRYCKGLISAAKFLLSFKDITEFRKVCDSMNTSDITREAFALFLSTKIDNMGFALACNFLKELGYQEYPKPDVHIIDICYDLGLISNKNPIDAYEATVKVAREANVSPYHLDKLWWLICSGNFYRYNKTVKPEKKNFIAATKRHFEV